MSFNINHFQWRWHCIVSFISELKLIGVGQACVWFWILTSLYYSDPHPNTLPKIADLRDSHDLVLERLGGGARARAAPVPPVAIRHCVDFGILNHGVMWRRHDVILQRDMLIIATHNFTAAPATTWRWRCHHQPCRPINADAFAWFMIHTF